MALETCPLHHSLLTGADASNLTKCLENYVFTPNPIKKLNQLKIQHCGKN
jgi:hypothetical protein